MTTWIITIRSCVVHGPTVVRPWHGKEETTPVVNNTILNRGITLSEDGRARQEQEEQEVHNLLFIEDSHSQASKESSSGSQSEGIVTSSPKKRRTIPPTSSDDNESSSSKSSEPLWEVSYDFLDYTSPKEICYPKKTYSHFLDRENEEETLTVSKWRRSDAAKWCRVHYYGLTPVQTLIFLYFNKNEDVTQHHMNNPNDGYVLRSEEVTITPLQPLWTINRWINNEQKKYYLQKLAGATILNPGKRGVAMDKFFYRNSIQIRTHDDIRHKAWLVHVATPTTRKAANSLWSNVTRRLKTFVDQTRNVPEGWQKITQVERMSFTKLALQGEAFYLTSFNPKGDDDLVMSAIMFKRSEGAIWINYIVTKPGEIPLKQFGYELDAVTPSFSGMGLATFLLKCVQIYQITNAQEIVVYIQCEVNSLLSEWITNRGGKELDEKIEQVEGTLLIPEEIKVAFPDFHPDKGCRYRSGDDQIIYKLEEGVAPDDIVDCPEENYTDGHTFKRNVNDQTDQRSKWPHDYVLFTYPLGIYGTFCDGYNAGLLLLGDPFYNYTGHDCTPFATATNEYGVLGNNFVIKTEIKGTHINNLDSLAKEDWMDNVIMNWIQSFLIRSTTTTSFMNMFFMVDTYVAYDISLVMKGGPYNETSIGYNLHEFFTNHRLRLTARFIIMPLRVNKNHWITYVAVNPIFKLKQMIEGGVSEEVYGYMIYDSLKPQSPTREDKTPERNSVLVYLLNGLARYYDYGNMGLTYPKPTTSQGVYSLGAVGPFGVAFTQEDDSNSLCTDLLKLTPDWRLPKIQVGRTVFPIQRDGFNCGVYQLLFIMDFMITQYNYNYSFQAMKHDGTDTYVIGDNFDDHLHSHQNITLPPDNNLGKGLFGVPINPATGDGAKVCELLRIELVALAERHHILFYNAFTKDGKKVNDRILGRLPPRYEELISRNTLIKKAIPLIGKRISRDAYTNATLMQEQCSNIMIALAGTGMLPANYYDRSPHEQVMTFYPTFNANEEGADHEQICDLVIRIMGNVWDCTFGNGDEEPLSPQRNQAAISIASTPANQAFPSTSRQNPLDIMTPSVAGESLDSFARRTFTDSPVDTGQILMWLV